MYKGELPGLEWDEKKRRYFAYSKNLDEPNLTPSSSSGAGFSSLQAGQVPTASPVIKSLKHSKRGKLFTCGVCLDEKRERVQLPCNHLFCRACLTNWLERKGHCPTCRQVVDVALHTAEMAARTEFNPISSTGFGSFNAETALQGASRQSDAYYQAGFNAEQVMSLHMPRTTSLVTGDQCSGTSDDSTISSRSNSGEGTASSIEGVSRQEPTPVQRLKRKSTTRAPKGSRRSTSSSSLVRTSRRGGPMKRRR